GVKVAMHLDLGATTSELRESLWSKVKATPVDVKLRLVDEVATVREVTHAATATDVTLGAAKSARVTLAPYVDKRFAVTKVDGALADRRAAGQGRQDHRRRPGGLRRRHADRARCVAVHPTVRRRRWLRVRARGGCPVTRAS